MAPETATGTVDVLLAHAFFIRNDPKQLARRRPYPPLGTLYAASQLRRDGVELALFDAMLSTGEEEFASLLARTKPRVVVFYEDQFNYLNKMCLSHARQATGRMGHLARQQGATVIAAGADVTDHPEVYFAQGIDVALVGEADHSLRQVVAALLGRTGQPTNMIPGVRISPDRSDLASLAVSTGRVEPERHPDVFPFPAWDLVDVDRYRQWWQEAHGFFSWNMVSTRGCPFSCNWCAKPIWGQRYAMRSPANVAEEMALLKRTVRPDHVWFADDIFGLQPTWVSQLARELEQRGGGVPFTIQSRVDLMTEESVAGLARAGCVEVWLGAESGSQRILNAMDKGIAVSQIGAARQRLQQAGIRACFFIQFGYPGEEWEDILTTVHLVQRLLPDDIGVSVSYPLPGTRFHQMVRAQLREQDHWSDSSDLAMMFRGTYPTPFYRRLHALLHRDLVVRQQLSRGTADGIEARRLLDELSSAWRELGQMAAAERTGTPLQLVKPALPILPPDLSARFN